MANRWGLQGYRVKPPRVITVIWKFPDKGCHKLNCDGVAKGNPENVGAGGLVRDGNDDVVFVYSISLGNKTNIFAKLAAIIEGL